MKRHEFVTYADADLGCYSKTRKSTTGFVVVLTEGLVIWMFKFQSTAALSTVEADINASAETVKQIMGQDGPSVVFEDNQVAVSELPRDDFNHFRSWMEVKVFE